MFPFTQLERAFVCLCVSPIRSTSLYAYDRYNHVISLVRNFIATQEAYFHKILYKGKLLTYDYSRFSTTQSTSQICCIANSIMVPEVTCIIALNIAKAARMGFPASMSERWMKRWRTRDVKSILSSTLRIKVGSRNHDEVSNKIYFSWGLINWFPLSIW